MTFDVVAVRSGDDDTDDRLYPVLSAADARYPFQTGPDDTNIATFVAKGLSITRHRGDDRSETIVDLSDHRIDVYVTDARVVLHCSKFSKGGGWVGFGVGGLAIAATANTVSKARAAARHRGKALVGQVRYQWLMKAGPSPKQGMLDANQIRLVMRDTSANGDALLFVTLTFASQTPVSEIARDIVQRAARHRIAGDTTVTGDEREAMTALTHAPALQAVKGKFVFWDLPTYYRTSSASVPYPNTEAR